MDAPKTTSRRRFLQHSAALTAAGLLAGRTRNLSAAEPALNVRTPDPYNAEPRLLALVADQITPVEHFYVRNHGATPKVDVANYKLRIDGLVEKPLELTLAEIKEKFPQQTIEATLTCAGNRRQEMSAIKPVGGVQWDAGAIGHARWTGPLLADVLREAGGMKSSVKHIWFEGLDPIKEKDGSVAPFGGSIPIEKVTSFSFGKTIPKSGIQAIASLRAMIVHSMNDQPLTPEHGFPLRIVVPGYIGARSVKWISKITLSDRPSPNHYLAEAYKIVQSDDKAEVAAASPIYGFPINAAICSPAAGAQVKAGKTLLGGYAIPSGEKPATVEKVELSRNGGKNWSPARLLGKGSAFSWQQWTAEMDLRPGQHELIVRATDSAGNTMPQRTDWNFKGYLYNAWHRITIDAV